MQLPFYKAKQDSKGSAIGFGFLSKVGEKKGVTFEIVKQSSWNSAKRTGSFAGSKCFCKLELHEVGSILNTIESFSAWSKSNEKKSSFYHKNAKGSAAINFTRTSFGSGEKEQRILGISVNLDRDGKKENFSTYLSMEETRVLQHWLRHALNHIFDGLYAEDKKRAAEYAKNKASE